MLAIVVPLLIAAAVLTGAPKPETTATPIPETAATPTAQNGGEVETTAAQPAAPATPVAPAGAEVETTVAQPAPSATPVAQAGAEVETKAAQPVPSAMPVLAQVQQRPIPANKTDICSTISAADLEKVQMPSLRRESPMEGFKNLLLQPCTLDPNEISVSLSYENMTTVQGSHGRDRVFLPNALIEIGSINPSLTFDLFAPTYSPGHTRDILLPDGDRTTLTSAGGNSDLAVGGTFRFDSRTSPFAWGVTGLAVVPTSERGFGTEALGGIVSVDFVFQYGLIDIDGSLAERFAAEGISPLSPYALVGGKGASDCDTGLRLTLPARPIRDDLTSDDRDKGYATFNPSLAIGTWVPLTRTEPTFIYVSGTYFSQTSADTESSRAAYHIGIVQPLSPRLNIGIDWGFSPSTETLRETQRALSTDITFKF